MTPEPSKDYLTSYAEREARERLQQRLTPRPSPSESTAIQPRETTLVLKAWVGQLLNACFSWTGLCTSGPSATQFGKRLWCSVPEATSWVGWHWVVIA